MLIAEQLPAHSAVYARATLPPMWRLYARGQQEQQAQREEDASDAADSETLPRGWRQVESRSRPGRVSYENSHLGSRAARISWRPLQRAPHTLHEHDAYLAQQAADAVRAETTCY